MTSRLSAANAAVNSNLFKMDLLCPAKRQAMVGGTNWAKGDKSWAFGAQALPLWGGRRTGEVGAVTALFQLVDDLAHVLGSFSRTHQERVRRVDDDQIMHA